MAFRYRFMVIFRSGWSVVLSNKASSTLAITLEDETTADTEN
ncbi:hypothetical protein [Komarekiella delphini-convector]|jgi:hypothetical protein|nr:hypothetical protein [Komarekiella delphini-convector]